MTAPALVADLQSQPQRTLARGGVGPVEGVLQFTSTLREEFGTALVIQNSSELNAFPNLTGLNE